MVIHCSIKIGKTGEEEASRYTLGTHYSVMLTVELKQITKQSRYG